MHAIDMPEQLIPIPDNEHLQAKTWELSLNTFRLQILQLRGPFFSMDNSFIFNSLKTQPTQSFESLL